MMFARQQPIPVASPTHAHLGRRRHTQTALDAAALSGSAAAFTASSVPRHWHHHAGSYAPDANEPLDLEALALAAGSEYEDTYRSSRWRAISDTELSSASFDGGGGGGSGLPLVCSNCGVSFFSLQITDDELECYCSGECKWSVVMYREMDRRMHVLRRHLRAAAAAAATTTSNAAALARADTKPKSYGSSMSSSRSSSATTDTDSCESYPRYVDDAISCR